MIRSYSAVIRSIDPSLHACRQLKPSSLLVFEAERVGLPDTRYILKFGRDDREDFVEHIDNESAVLTRARDVQGITHLVRDYGMIGHYRTILKEYVPGTCLHHYWAEGNTPSQELKSQLETTLERLVELRIANMDIRYTNVVVAPDGRSATIIDLGYAKVYPDTGAEFQDAAYKDLQDLEEVLTKRPKQRFLAELRKCVA